MTFVEKTEYESDFGRDERKKKLCQRWKKNGKRCLVKAYDTILFFYGLTSPISTKFFSYQEETRSEISKQLRFFCARKQLIALRALPPTLPLFTKAHCGGRIHSLTRSFSIPDGSILRWLLEELPISILKENGRIIYSLFIPQTDSCHSHIVHWGDSVDTKKTSVGIY